MKVRKNTYFIVTLYTKDGLKLAKVNFLSSNMENLLAYNLTNTEANIRLKRFAEDFAYKVPIMDPTIDMMVSKSEYQDILEDKKNNPAYYIKKYDVRYHGEEIE